MNSRTPLRRPRGPQAGTLTLPGYEQQNTAEKKNRLKLALSRCHVMNSRPLLRRPTGPQAGILRCHVMNSRALLRRPRGAQAGTLTLPCHEQQNSAEKTNRFPSWHSLCHVMNSRALLRKPRGAQDSWCIPGAFLVHSWFTPGALLVHSWCTPGALPVHSRCTPGALSVHSKGFPKGNCFAPERKPRSSVQKRLDCFFANLQTRKGNCTASERKPRSSAQKRLDRFSPICKLERELHFSERKSRSSAQKRLDRLFANLQTRKGIAPLPKGSLDPPHRNVWIAQEITTFITERGVTTTRPQQNTPQTLPTERSMNGPGAHPAQRAAGTCRCVSTATFILRTAPVALEATAQPGQPPRVRQLGET